MKNGDVVLNNKISSCDAVNRGQERQTDTFKVCTLKLPVFPITKWYALRSTNCSTCTDR